jgi:hypothetical protein
VVTTPPVPHDEGLDPGHWGMPIRGIPIGVRF